NEKLKHIPVMLLVGSFEPFDEAEARRVGADDILTKPFQSIRRLIDRVGALVSSPPAEKERPTAELPKAEEPAAEEELMDTYDLEVSTADTLPLDEAIAAESLPREVKMEQETRNDSDVLLDLGDYEPVSASDDEFVLDLDEDAPREVVTPAYEPAAPVRAFVEPQVREAAAAATYSSFAETQEIPYATDEVAVVEPEPERVAEPQRTPEPQSISSAASAASISPDQLSPEMIDAIARRVVEMMSDKVVREIAWEVVPDMAELLIKKQLEERQAK
ncbi:MAG TPA: hypothetical protein VFR78_16045, partial [Pyrinomonadaceae bacterium]|nr:hypothetical protein [Pyrinomonadaceae bacterium]